MPSSRDKNQPSQKPKSRITRLKERIMNYNRSEPSTPVEPEEPFPVAEPDTYAGTQNSPAEIMDSVNGNVEGDFSKSGVLDSFDNDMSFNTARGDMSPQRENSFAIMTARERFFQQDTNMSQGLANLQVDDTLDTNGNTSTVEREAPGVLPSGNAAFQPSGSEDLFSQHQVWYTSMVTMQIVPPLHRNTIKLAVTPPVGKYGGTQSPMGRYGGATPPKNLHLPQDTNGNGIPPTPEGEDTVDLSISERSCTPDDDSVFPAPTRRSGIRAPRPSINLYQGSSSSDRGL